MDKRSARKLFGVSFTAAIREPALLGSALVGDLSTWQPWLAALRALFGLPLFPPVYGPENGSYGAFADKLLGHRPRRRQIVHALACRGLRGLLPRLPRPLRLLRDPRRSRLPSHDRFRLPQLRSRQCINAGARPSRRSRACCRRRSAQHGVLYDGFRDNFGRDDAPCLVWQAATSTMNPSFDRGLIERKIAKDPAKNSAEYLAEFRSDICGFLSREELDACVMVGVFERAPMLPGAKYVAFVDPSGGGPDDHVLAIAHRKEDRIILDCIRVRHGSPEAATAEFGRRSRAMAFPRSRATITRRRGRRKLFAAMESFISAALSLARTFILPPPR